MDSQSSGYSSGYNRFIETRLSIQMAERRDEQDVESARRPHCGIIPSPEKLKRGKKSPGEDETNVRGDFNLVWKWLTSSEFLNTGVYDVIREAVDAGEQLDKPSFNSAIYFAFKAFDPIRNTVSLEAEEMVLLYYTGHGIGEKEARRVNRKKRPDGQSSSPLLKKVDIPEEYFSAAQPYLTQKRNVKGGELCLHEVGFCDLQGLLEPWIAAVKKKPTHNSSGEKKKKHVIVIADSCYSGKLVEDLAELNQSAGPWNKKGCTVTVQSASSSDEETYGGYFTPCFVHYNKPENRDELEQLIQEWKRKIEIEKDAYRTTSDPSPQLATTKPEKFGDENSPILECSFQGFKLCLFRDAGFFKFCYLKHSQALPTAKLPRELNDDTLQKLLEQNPLKINDYKLTKTRNGVPKALFLVYDPDDDKPVICVHIHFKNSHTTELQSVSGVHLVEHERPTYPSLLFLVVNDSNPRTILEPHEKFVKKCKEYVETMEPGRWIDVNRWNMKNNQMGYHHVCKMDERSEWMCNYLDKIDRKHVKL